MANDAKIIERYKTISGSESVSEETTNRILKIKEVLNVRDDDALWSVFIVLEMYLRSIDHFNDSIGATFKDALVEYKNNGGEIKLIEQDDDKKLTYANVVCIFGIVLLLCAISFAAGVNLNSYSPEWITSVRYASPIAYVMQIPAGWLFFVMASCPAIYQLYKIKNLVSMGSGTKKERVMKYMPYAMISCLLILIGIFVLYLTL